MKKILLLCTFVILFSGCAQKAPAPNQPLLTDNIWFWATAKDADGSIITPNKQGIFTLTFTKDGRLNIGTDCNNMGAGYTAKDGQLILTEIMSTMMYCEGSQEGKFSALIGSVTGYKLTDSGELVLSSDKEPELMIFKAENNFWRSQPKGDFAADTRDPNDVCKNIQTENQLENCTLKTLKSSFDKQECADGMSVAGCFACEFECK